MKVYECILTSGAFMITGRDASPLLRNLFEILQISLSFLNLNPQNVVSFFFFSFFCSFFKFVHLNYYSIHDVCLKGNGADNVLRCAKHRPQSGRSIRKSTKRSCGVSLTLCARNDEGCDSAHLRHFTTTVHLFTTPWASGCSRARRTSSYWNNIPIHLILVRVVFFFISPS